MDVFNYIYVIMVQWERYKSVLTLDILLYMDVFNYIHVIMVKDFFCNFYCNDKIY